MKPSKKQGWMPIHKFKLPDRTIIDLWMDIPASPLTMGMSDSFTVPDAWCEHGSWWHTFQGKSAMLNDLYVTHWRRRQNRSEALHDTASGFID